MRCGCGVIVKNTNPYHDGFNEEDGVMKCKSRVGSFIIVAVISLAVFRLPAVLISSSALPLEISANLLLNIEHCVLNIQLINFKCSIHNVQFSTINVQLTIPAFLKGILVLILLHPK